MTQLSTFGSHYLGSLATILIAIIQLICLPYAYSSSTIKFNAPQNDLVVISHGLMGRPFELDYLANALRSQGIQVLLAQGNDFHRTLRGVSAGAESLATEIRAYKAANSHIQRISFVGNSLGGIYARYVVRLLLDENNETLAGMIPFKFMTVATPHLGVRDFNFLDDHGIPAPHFLKRIVGASMLSTGYDLFLSDATYEDISNSLIYELALNESFLRPLRLFNERRLYANLANDLMVPLGTAAFLPHQQVAELRRTFRSKTNPGVVTIIPSVECAASYHDAEMTKHAPPSVNSALRRMADSLNACGWEKVIVYFPGALPLAHNKICALSKPPLFMSQMLGFSEGRPVMDHAAAWLAN